MSLHQQIYTYTILLYGTNMHVYTYTISGANISRYKLNVWLSPHTLVIILNLTTTYFFKISFESSRATPGNPS